MVNVQKRVHIQVEDYTDGDWVDNINGRMSTSMYDTSLGEKFSYTEKKKKQNVIVKSWTETEFCSVAHDFYKVLWIKKFIDELKISSPKSIKVYCDSKTTISIAHNLVIHDTTKYVKVDKHFIKQNIDNGDICMSYVPTTS